MTLLIWGIEAGFSEEPYVVKRNGIAYKGLVYDKSLPYVPRYRYRVGQWGKRGLFDYDYGNIEESFVEQNARSV